MAKKKKEENEKLQEIARFKNDPQINELLYNCVNYINK